jgi:hypothetical protein
MVFLSRCALRSCALPSNERLILTTPFSFFHFVSEKLLVRTCRSDAQAPRSFSIDNDASTMSDNGLYDGALGAYDDYTEYMMTSGLGGVGQVDNIPSSNNSSSSSSSSSSMFWADAAGKAPGPNPPGARALKKARVDNDAADDDDDEEEEDGERNTNATEAGDPKTSHGPKGGESIQPGGGNADRRRRHNQDASGEGEHGAGVGNEGEEEDAANADDDNEEEVEDDPQAAAFREHTQGELGRVCSTLQACLQDLAAEFMSYYHASVQVKEVYEQVLAKERAEARRLDALEPQVKLLKELVRSTAGMGGGTGGSGAGAGSLGGGPGGSVPSAAAARSASSGARSMVPMQSHPYQPQPQSQPLRRHLQQGPRHPAHGK